MSTLLNKPIIQLAEKTSSQHQNIVQLQITSMKDPVTENFLIHDKFIPVPDYIIPLMRSRDDSNSRIVKRKTLLDISREIPTYPDPYHRPLPKQTEIPLQEIPRKLMDFDVDINTDFKRKFPLSRRCYMRNVSKTQ